MSGDEAEAGRPGSALYRVAGLNTCAGLLFGYSTASIAGWLDEIGREFALDTAGKETATVALVICCFFGAIAAGPLARARGRRAALFVAFALAAAGYALTLTHPDHGLFLFARALIGLAVGLSSMAAPMYAGEATPAAYRGRVVSLFQLAVTMGILIAYTVPLWMEDPQKWALGIGLGGIIPLAGVLALWSVPESPVWLGSKGRVKEAGIAAGTLGLAPTSWQVEATGGRPSLAAIGQVLRQGSTLAVLGLCCALFILQNLSGIDGILYYAPTIFTELGFSAGTAALGATFGLGLINLVATIVGIRLIDSLGRRPLAIVGSLVMVAGLLGVVVAHLTAIPVLGLVALCLYIGAFAISLGPLPYVMMSELVPSSIRESGIALASATSWLFNALVAFVFLSGVSAFGLTGVFLFFAAICIVALALSLAWLPETRGASLNEIETKVLAGSPLRRIAAGPPDIQPRAGEPERPEP